MLVLLPPSALPAEVEPEPTPTTQDSAGAAPASQNTRDVGYGGESELDQPIGDQSPDPNDQPVTGALRAGGYTDSDKTTVLRALGIIARSWEHWMLNGSLGVDSVTSASVDVRSSPALSKVDVITSASGRSSTSGGKMTDTRVQATGGAGWKDDGGAAMNLTTAVAAERDYTSVSGGLNGSFDLLDRALTVLGGASLTQNWVSSVLDSTLHEKMTAAAWSTGFAFVLTPYDALRLRYDGKASIGYLASPYRTVRFGNWTPSFTANQITFSDTIGSADGLPEQVPKSRIGHAAVLEWLHSLAPGLGLHPLVRVSHDSWNIDSLTAGLDLRIAADAWRMQAGYRLYLQSSAKFFEDKYTLAPQMYQYYTSDKELGAEVGHLLQLDLAFVLSEARRPNESRTLLNLQVEAARYQYLGFVLLPSRESLFATIGVTWEL